MKLSEIKQTIGTVATVTGDDDVEIRYLLTDSRQLQCTKDDVRCTKNNDVQSTKAAQTLILRNQDGEERRGKVYTGVGEERRAGIRDR